MEGGTLGVDYYFIRQGGGSKPAVVPKVKRADLGEKNKFYYDEKVKVFLRTYA